VISANSTELHRDFNALPHQMKDAEFCKFQMHLICLFGAEGETAIGIEKITTSISPVQELHNNISIRYGFLSTAAGKQPINQSINQSINENLRSQQTSE
jgi:hypothetical protein